MYYFDLLFYDINVKVLILLHMMHLITSTMLSYI